MSVFLHRELRTPKLTRELDSRALVRQVSQLHMPSHWPRRVRPRWTTETILIVDASTATKPLHEDLWQLVERAWKLSGRRIFIYVRLGECWWQCSVDTNKPKAIGWRRIADEERVDQALYSARHWLMAGDLGSSDSSAGDSAYWQARWQRHLRAGGTLSLLLWQPPSNALSRLSPAIRAARWDYDSRLCCKRLAHIAPTSLQNGISISGTTPLDRLLAALSLATNIEFKLLRGMRIQLGLPVAYELSAWNDPRMFSGADALQFRESQAAFFEQLETVDIDIQDRLINTALQHHVGSDPFYLWDVLTRAAALTQARNGGSDAELQDHVEQLWRKVQATIEQNPKSAVARELSGFLARAGHRASPRMWQKSEAFASAYLSARRARGQTGGAVPASFPQQWLDGMASVDAAALPIWLVQDGEYLVVQTISPGAHHAIFAELQPAKGLIVREKDGESVWLPVAPQMREPLAKLSADTSWTLSTSLDSVTLACIPRPSWALEWGRDRKGLYALAPSPCGKPVKLWWQTPTVSLSSNSPAMDIVRDRKGHYALVPSSWGGRSNFYLQTLDESPRSIAPAFDKGSVSPRNEKTVFISYRRAHSASWARLIYTELTSQGYDVFFDYQGITGDDFEKTTLENIRARAHFLILLSPRALDRCDEPGDGLRREIETAIESQRNIVPLLLDGFSFGSDEAQRHLNGKLKILARYSGLRVHNDYFNDAMDRLRRYFLRIPLSVPQPITAEPGMSRTALISDQGQDEYGLWAEIDVAGITQRLRWIEPGEFLMGSPGTEKDGFDDERPQHQVRLTQGYWLADTACTQAMWQAVMGNNPSHFTDDPENPVETVSWDDAQAFLKALQAQLLGCRPELPTEAEWEYACRAGTQSAYSFGDRFDPKLANCYESELKRTQPTKRYTPNAWGLYQMHGNVWEGCADGLRHYRAEAEVDPHDLEPEGESAVRVVRGGSWGHDARGARSAFRFQWYRDDRSQSRGFRFLLRSMVSKVQETPEVIKNFDPKLIRASMEKAFREVASENSNKGSRDRWGRGTPGKRK